MRLLRSISVTRKKELHDRQEALDQLHLAGLNPNKKTNKFRGLLSARELIPTERRTLVDEI
jgi:hypothetical protein